MSKLAQRWLVLAVVAALFPIGVAAQANPVVRIIELGGDGSSEASYAQGGGFFKKYGLDATITDTEGGGAAIAAVVGGSAEIGFSNLISVVAAIERGIPITIIAPASVFSSKSPNILLVKSRRSALKTGADLRGKVVAVTTLDGELQLGAQVWIDKTGGDWKAVHFVEIPLSAMAAALAQGRVDAAMMTEPSLSRARADVAVLGNADAGIAPYFISGAFFAANAWIDAHPDLAHRASQALRDGAHWANTHHAETAAILARSTSLDPATIATMTRATFAETLTPALIQPAVDVAYKYGRLKEPLDMTAIVERARPFWERRTLPAQEPVSTPR